MTEPHTSALIVALPSEGDPLSTLQPGQDPDPHITLCWFGSADGLDAAREDEIRGFVQDIAGIVDPFEVSVSGTDTLGDDEAKVLMLDSDELIALRDFLVSAVPIQSAMNQVEQFPQFTPHLTWSYDKLPKSPPETVQVDRLGLWLGENRETFPLGDPATFTAALMAAGEPVVDNKAALTPDNSDVPPLYLALTDAVDKDAVLDVLALVPASATNSTPVVYSRADGGWQLDDEMRRAMLSTNPPPIVQLDADTAKDVISQVDTFYQREDKSADSGDAKSTAVMDVFGDLRVYSEFGELFPVPTEDEALYAAGGADRNRGNAEKLRRYWTVGPGGAKIRWGTGGDWYRCVKHLSKYLGPRAKGYCQLRHREMTGMYTSTHAKMERGKHGKGSKIRASAADLAEINAAAMRAFVAAGGTIDQVAAPDVAPVDAPEHGARFRIPLVVPEGVETGDGRRFAPLSLTTRELPLPLLWQLKTAEGHDGSVVVGRIDNIDRIDNGLGNATGVFDVGPYGREVERLVRGKFLRGISADLDKFEAVAEEGDLTEDGEPDPNRIGGGKMLINKARVSAITVVARPAFEECTISLIEDDDD